MFPFQSFSSARCAVSFACWRRITARHAASLPVGAAATPALIVPVSALIFRSEGLRVGVIRDGKALLMPVTMGKDFGSEVEIVSGLKPDDQVIENPPDSFVSGMEVRVVKPAKVT